MTKKKDQNTILLIFTDVSVGRNDELDLLELKRKKNHLIHLTFGNKKIIPILDFVNPESKNNHILVFNDNQGIEPYIENLGKLKTQFSIFGAFHKSGMETTTNISILNPTILDFHQLFPRGSSPIQRMVSKLIMMSDDELKENFNNYTQKLIDEMKEKAQLNKSLQLLHLGLSISDIRKSKSFNDLYEEIQNRYLHIDTDMATKMYKLKDSDDDDYDYEPDNHQEWLAKLRDLLLN